MKKFVDKVLDVLPIPFWVYFFSILAGTTGILPHQSPAYDWTTKHLLPAAIALMLIGTPLTELIKMGPKALAATAIGTGTIFTAQVFSFILMIRVLPEDAWMSVGALMGTWIGGSANMVAVKEILQMPDGNLSALVIVDTIISYGWMALLLSGVAFQKRYDGENSAEQFAPTAGNSASRGPSSKILAALAVIIIGITIAEISVAMGKIINSNLSFLSVSGWSLLSASTLALILALTPLRQLKTWGSQKIGTLLLYLVLITIGAKTSLNAALQSPMFLVYGALTLFIHGIFSLIAGKVFKIPLFLLSTSSQANIGGAVSAPIVAEAYRPGTAHIGVLMAVTGAVLGTYLGVAGGYLCRTLAIWLR